MSIECPWPMIFISMIPNFWNNEMRGQKATAYGKNYVSPKKIITNNLTGRLIRFCNNYFNLVSPIYENGLESLNQNKQQGFNKSLFYHVILYILLLYANKQVFWPDNCNIIYFKNALIKRAILKQHGAKQQKCFMKWLKW